MKTLISNPKGTKNLLNNFCLVLLLCLSVGSINAQEQKSTTVNSEAMDVKGSVILIEDGTALQDVNVYLENSTVGTKTDSKGDFKFPQKLKKGDVLVFSYVGLKSQKVTIINEASARLIRLRTDSEMQEIILYSDTAKKKTYSSSN